MNYSKIVEVKASNTKKKFLCSSKDKIMDNGSCYQLMSIKISFLYLML